MRVTILERSWELETFGKKIMMYKNVRYRVDLNFVEFYLIQLRMDMIFTGLPNRK